MENRQARKPRYCCSFCHKSQEEVGRLIAGQDAVYICDECIGLCREILAEEGLAGAKNASKSKRP